MREAFRRIVVAPAIAGLLIGGFILSKTNDETPEITWNHMPAATTTGGAQ